MASNENKDPMGNLLSWILPLGIFFRSGDLP